jgi:hypothetical protein
LQEYSIINNILLYDIRIGGVDCTRFRFPACIYRVFEWKNPGKKLANFTIIESSSTFWTGSAALSPMELNREADDRHLKTVEKEV